MGLPSDFRTGNMPKNLLATGMFVELRGAKYTDQSAYLGKGDVLVTVTHGHTAVVLDDGVEFERRGAGSGSTRWAIGCWSASRGGRGREAAPAVSHPAGLRSGQVGRGTGEFGDATELAVKAFQKDKGLDADGQYGKKTHAALLEALERDEDARGETVAIDGGNCYVRDEPGVDGKILGVAHRGDALAYAGEAAENGWIKVKYKDRVAGCLENTEL